MKNESNRPVISNRDKLLSISAFLHTETDENGKTHNSYGASLQRAFQRPEQKGSHDYTRQAISCYPEELLRIAALCVRTYNDIILHAQQNKQTATANYPAAQVDVDDVPPIDDDDIPFA